MSTLLKIGELARQANCPVETIRFYERQELLPQPARSSSNYRLYTDAHVGRLQFIRHCRSLDMSLEEIRSLLRFRQAPEESCAEVNQLLDRHVSQVAQRITELQALQQQLQELRSQCSQAQAAKDCGILQKLATPECALPASAVLAEEPQTFS